LPLSKKLAFLLLIFVRDNEFERLCMREIPLGELSNLKLFDVLKTLLVEKKSGILVVKGKETGELYLESGNIVHAKAGLLSGEEAFLAIMAWRMGKSVFKQDMACKERTISCPAEDLLLKWSYRKQEWEEVRELVPSSGAVFRLSLQQNPGEMNIRTDQWNVLALANGVRTVSEITEAIVGWDEFKTSKMIFELVDEGLLERGEEQAPVRKKKVRENFFPSLEHELKKVMGPVASFIIEDKLAEFGERKDAFPQDQAPLFVELLSEEIASDPKRKEFAKAMSDLLTGKNGMAG
jgi:hypothetical protein